MNDEQQLYLVREFNGIQPSVSILKFAPDPEKFKFLRMYPPDEKMEEWVPIEMYDRYVKMMNRDTLLKI
jgi:hypothetical protein